MRCDVRARRDVRAWCDVRCAPRSTILFPRAMVHVFVYDVTVRARCNVRARCDVRERCNDLYGTMVCLGLVVPVCFRSATVLRAGLAVRLRSTMLTILRCDGFVCVSTSHVRCDGFVCNVTCAMLRFCFRACSGACSRLRATIMSSAASFVCFDCASHIFSAAIDFFTLA